MAFVKKQLSDSTHKFIHPDDGAINAEESDIESYVDTWDESHLVMIPEEKPSYFVVKSRLSAEENKVITDVSIGVKDTGLGVNQGTLQYETLRRCLVDIINPSGADGIVYHKDSKGLVSKKTMRELSDYSAGDAVYVFFNHLQNRSTKELKKS
jgi:hypothetical protein